METIRSLSALSVFEKVAKHNSFSMAAQELGVSKAYISKLVQGLELELGEKLFHRSTRRVKLTIVGESLYRQCAGPLSEIERIKRDLQTSSKIPRGLFRISVAGAFGEEIITPIVFELLQKYDGLRVELSFSSKNVDLFDESFDIAIRVGELADSNLIARKIATRREYICASKKYLSQRGVPKEPSELRDHYCLTGGSDTWTFHEKNSVKRIKVHGPFKSDNGRSLLKGALAGMGIVKLPDVYVLKYIESGHLKVILDKYMPKEIPVWAVSLDKKSHSINVKVFLEALEKSITQI